MRRAFIACVAMALLLPACGGDDKTRTVLVDYSSDQYASFALFNFPKKIAVHPGTTLIFRQTWTGEPHTVTGGTAVNKPLADARPLLDVFVTYDAARAQGEALPDPESEQTKAMKFADFAKAIKGMKDTEKRDTMVNAWNALRRQGVKVPDLDNPGAATFSDADKAIEGHADKVFGSVPFVWGEDGSITQSYGQPCYLKQGMPPDDAKKPCTKEQQVRPAFDGTHNFYSSGIIRYEGAQGNTFRVPLSENIKPGKYTFYCAVHGPTQSTEVEVKPDGEDVPSQEDITRQAREQINVLTKPLDETWSDARDGRLTLVQGEERINLSSPFSGVYSPKVVGSAAINEFIPKNITVKANAPIVWKMMGADHTISFGVPTYFPPFEFLKDGAVRINPRLEPAAGGARPVPREESEDGPPTAASTKHDGGTYSGTGFWSSGLIGEPPYLEYTMRIAKPGRYRVACLIHPPMVGNVTVTA
jgi:plastocyanin